MKKKLIMVLLLICSLTFVLMSCKKTDKKYFENVTSYSFWDNKSVESIPQKSINGIVEDFLRGKVIDGNIISEDGKVKKVAFLGLDGVRADALANILHDKNNFQTNDYNYKQEFSGLNLLKETGGVYLAFAGGEKGKLSQQSTSTCSGWTSQMTGFWSDKHGVKENDNIKNAEYDTFVLKQAKRGLTTGLAFDWGQLFDTTLKHEVKYLLSNPTINARFYDVDRVKVNTMEDIRTNEKLGKKGKINADNVAEYNFSSVDNVSDLVPYDVAMRDHLLNRIKMDDDIVAGIFHNPDSNGHTDGFSNANNNYVNSVRNADLYSYQIIKYLNERMKDYNEDWLIIMSTDHGGYGNGHGKQYAEARTTWMATNKSIDSKYFGKNYDGFKEN